MKKLFNEKINEKIKDMIIERKKLKWISEIDKFITLYESEKEHNKI